MKKTLFIYLALSFLLLLNVTLDVVKGISLNGYWSDRVLFWIWLLFTLYLIFSYWNKKGVRIYTWCLGILLVLSMLPMFIPFFAVIVTGFGFDRSFGKSLDDSTRIQVTGKSLIGRPNVELIERKGIYEKLVGEMSGFEFENDNLDLTELQTLKVLEENENSLLVEFQLTNQSVKHRLDKK